MALDAIGPRPDKAGTDSTFDAALASWRTQGRDLVAAHWSEFQALIDPVEEAIARGRFAEAAATAQVAAAYAVFWNPGAFVSHRLERALMRIGQAALRAPGRQAHTPRATDPRRVLHVATKVGKIGGHARNMSRWMANDRKAVHSIALTRQTEAAPEFLRQSVAASGGTIASVNSAMGGPLAWAAGLQRHLADADLVVLHVHNQDIVAFLALAGLTQRPQVVLLNHADHIFWIGSDFVDAVVNTRWSGHALCAERRDIEADRNLTLPLCLEPVSRQRDRAAAKIALGIDPEDILLLTVARSVKFRRIGGTSFADTLLPVLKQNSRVRLIAVGPGGVVDWSSAERQVPGRIQALPETPKTRPYFEAADIYIDSFPFPSNTSLLEAGLHGLPLVTRRPFGPGCEVMGADSIGIDETLQTPGSPEAFRSEVGRLVNSPQLRLDLGNATRSGIETTNTGAGYAAALAGLYNCLDGLPPRAPAVSSDAGPRFDALDLFCPFVFGPSSNTSQSETPDRRRALAVELSLKTMPFVSRVKACAWLARNRAFTFRTTRQAWRYLVPEWLTARANLLRARRSGW